MPIEIVSEREILHRSDATGLRVIREQVIRVAGREETHLYWAHLPSGRLSHVETREAR